MGGLVSGWACPGCTSTGTHHIEQYIKNRAEENIGFRVHCVGCELSFDAYLNPEDDPMVNLDLWGTLHDS